MAYCSPSGTFRPPLYFSSAPHGCNLNLTSATQYGVCLLPKYVKSAFSCIFFHFIGHNYFVLVNPTLEWFNAQLQNDPKYLQKMVKKHFIGEFYSSFT